MKIDRYIQKHHLVLFISISLLLTVLMYFLYQPFVQGDDYIFHLNRLNILMQNIKSGSFPIYMDYNTLNGFGYPHKLFYSDFLLIPFAYVGNLVTCEFAYQVLIVTNTVLCTIFSFYAVKKITHSTYAGYLGSILYTFSAYRIIDIYMRSAVGEIFAITFIPIVAIGLYEILVGNPKKWYILSIGMSLLIYAHLLSSLLMGLVCIVALVINYKWVLKEPLRIKYIAISSLVCILLSMYFVVPMLEQFCTNTFYIQIEELRKDFEASTLYSMIWGLIDVYRRTYKGYYIIISSGILLVIILPIRLLIKEKTRIIRRVDLYMLWGIVVLLCTTNMYPWKIYPFHKLDIIQFPWRLNMIATCLLVIPTSFYLKSVIKKKWSLLLVVSMTILFMINHSTYYRQYGKEYIEHEVKTYNGKERTIEEQMNNTNATIVTGEYLPARIPSPYMEKIVERGDVVRSNNECTIVTDFKKEKGHVTFNVSLEKNDTLELPLIYYKGYRVTLDAEDIKYEQSKLGLIEVAVNKSTKVEVEYVGTTLQKISYYVSIASIILLVIFVISDKKRQ